MNYLTRLKQLDEEKISQYIPDTVPPKPTEVPFDSFDSTPLAHIKKNFIEEAENKILDIPIEADCQKRQKYRCWLVHFADNETLQCCFTPATCFEEVLECYPEAVAAEPFEMPEIVEVGI